jgi:hypothetical protein
MDTKFSNSELENDGGLICLDPLTPCLKNNGHCTTLGVQMQNRWGFLMRRNIILAEPNPEHKGDVSVD